MTLKQKILAVLKAKQNKVKQAEQDLQDKIKSGNLADRFGLSCFTAAAQAQEDLKEFKMGFVSELESGDVDICDNDLKELIAERVATLDSEITNLMAANIELDRQCVLAGKMAAKVAFAKL